LRLVIFYYYYFMVKDNTMLFTRRSFLNACHRTYPRWININTPLQQHLAVFNTSTATRAALQLNDEPFPDKRVCRELMLAQAEAQFATGYWVMDKELELAKTMSMHPYHGIYAAAGEYGVQVGGDTYYNEEQLVPRITRPRTLGDTAFSNRMIALVLAVSAERKQFKSEFWISDEHLVLIQKERGIAFLDLKSPQESPTIVSGNPPVKYYNEDQLTREGMIRLLEKPYDAASPLAVRPGGRPFPDPEVAVALGKVGGPASVWLTLTEITSNSFVKVRPTAAGITVKGETYFDGNMDLMVKDSLRKLPLHTTVQAFYPNLVTARSYEDRLLPGEASVRLPILAPQYEGMSRYWVTQKDLDDASEVADHVLKGVKVGSNHPKPTVIDGVNYYNALQLEPSILSRLPLPNPAVSHKNDFLKENKIPNWICQMDKRKLGAGFS